MKAPIGWESSAKWALLDLRKDNHYHYLKQTSGFYRKSFCIFTYSLFIEHMYV